MRIALLCLFAVLIAGTPFSPRAESKPEKQASEASTTQSEVGATLSDKERLNVDGYLGRPANSHPGSLTGGALALGPGFFFHGLGHFRLGQQGRGFALLASEFVGISMVVASEFVGQQSSDKNQEVFLSQILSQSGWSLFFGSWFADIIGATRGTRPFDLVPGKEQDTFVETGYTYIKRPKRLDLHLLRIGLELDRPYYRVDIDHEHDSKLGMWRTQMLASLGVHNDSIGTFHLGLHLDYWAATDEGWRLLSTTPTISGEINLGLLMTSLNNAFLIGRIGYGGIGYRQSDGSIPDVWAPSSYWSRRFVYETGLKFALRDGAQLRTSMLSDNLAWVSPTQFRPLDSIGGSPMLLKAGFSYPYKDIELQIESISGDGQLVTIGLEYHQ